MMGWLGEIVVVWRGMGIIYGGRDASSGALLVVKGRFAAVAERFSAVWPRVARPPTGGVGVAGAAAAAAAAC